MFNVGGPEFLVILLVALLVLGPDRLPDAIRKVGSVVREFKKISDGFQNEFRDAMELPGEAIIKPQSPPNLTAVSDDTPTVSSSSEQGSGAEVSDGELSSEDPSAEEAPPDEEAL